MSDSDEGSVELTSSTVEIKREAGSDDDSGTPQISDLNYSMRRSSRKRVPNKRLGSPDVETSPKVKRRSVAKPKKPKSVEEDDPIIDAKYTESPKKVARKSRNSQVPPESPKIVANGHNHKIQQVPPSPPVVTNGNGTGSVSDLIKRMQVVKRQPVPETIDPFKEYPFIKRSSRGPSFAYCLYCKVTIELLYNNARFYIMKHMRSVGHQGNVDFLGDIDPSIFEAESANYDTEKRKWENEDDDNEPPPELKPQKNVKKRKSTVPTIENVISVIEEEQDHHLESKIELSECEIELLSKALLINKDDDQIFSFCLACEQPILCCDEKMVGFHRNSKEHISRITAFKKVESKRREYPSFDRKWLNDSYFMDCLQRVPKFPSLAYCKLCRKIMLADVNDLFEHLNLEKHDKKRKILRRSSCDFYNITKYRSKLTNKRRALSVCQNDTVEENFDECKVEEKIENITPTPNPAEPKKTFDFDSADFFGKSPPKKTIVHHKIVKKSHKGKELLKDANFTNWLSVDGRDGDFVKCNFCHQKYFAARWILARHAEEHGIVISPPELTLTPENITTRQIKLECDENDDGVIQGISFEECDEETEEGQEEYDQYGRLIVKESFDVQEMLGGASTSGIKSYRGVGAKISNQTMHRLTEYMDSKNFDSPEQCMEHLLQFAQPARQSLEQMLKDCQTEMKVEQRFGKFVNDVNKHDYYALIDELMDVYNSVKRTGPCGEMFNNIEHVLNTKPERTKKGQLLKHTTMPLIKLLAERDEDDPNLMWSLLEDDDMLCTSGNDPKFRPFKRVTAVNQLFNMSDFSKKILPFRGSVLEFPLRLPRDTPADYFWRQIDDKMCREIYDILLMDLPDHCYEENVISALTTNGVSKDCPISFTKFMLGTLLKMTADLIRPAGVIVPRFAENYAGFLPMFYRITDGKDTKIGKLFRLIRENPLNVPPSQYITLSEHLIMLQKPGCQQKLLPENEQAVSVENYFGRNSKNIDFNAVILADSYGFVYDVETFTPQQSQWLNTNLVLRMLTQSLSASNNHKVLIDVQTRPRDALVAAVASLTQFEAIASVPQDIRIFDRQFTLTKSSASFCALAALSVTSNVMAGGGAAAMDDEVQCELFVTKCSSSHRHIMLCSSYVSATPFAKDSYSRSIPAAVAEYNGFGKAVDFRDITIALHRLANYSGSTPDSVACSGRQFLFYVVVLARNAWSLYNRHREFFDQAPVTFGEFLNDAGEKLVKKVKKKSAIESVTSLM